MKQNSFNKKAIFIGEEDFDRILQEYPLVVVCFVISGCDLSDRIKPIINKLANEYFSRVKVVKIDIKKNKQITQKFEIACLPNIFYFQHGKRVNNLVGLFPYEVIQDQLEELL